MATSERDPFEQEVILATMAENLGIEYQLGSQGSVPIPSREMGDDRLAAVIDDVEEIIAGLEAETWQSLLDGGVNTDAELRVLFIGYADWADRKIALEKAKNLPTDEQ